MDSDDPPKQDKQITVDVPEDRVPEFYAFYGRFLAATQHGRRGRRGHGRCGHRGQEPTEQRQPATDAPAA